MDNSIVVLMSAYNGEKYIREQLDSILDQEGVAVTLLIRDDGSTDGTRDIIQDYDDRFPNVRFLNREERKNLGFNGSFYALMEEGLSFEKDNTLFAFADQDDVWLPDKLISAVRLIHERTRMTGQSVDKNPLYYYSNKKWTNEKLEVQHEDDMTYCKGNYFDMFMLPPVYGCTTVFNRVLAEKTLEKKPPRDLLYDVFMYRMACTMDSIIIADKTAHILYRRHGDNASGDAMSLSPLKHLKRLLSGNGSFHGMQHYIESIYALHSDEMMDEQKTLCETIIGYRTSLKKRFRLLTWRKAYERGAKAALIWAGRVILNAI